MTFKIITLELGSKEIKAKVDFCFTPEVPARLHGLPENRYQGEPEEWSIGELFLMDNEKHFTVDISELINYIEDDIIEAIKEAD